jgi:hypothetical protein
VYRPGGSALNAGQVGGIRAAMYIAHFYRNPPPERQAVEDAAGEQIAQAIRFGEEALARGPDAFSLRAERAELQERMSRCGAAIRSEAEVREAVVQAAGQLQRIARQGAVDSPLLLGQLYRIRDLAVSQFVYLSAIEDYIRHGGRSRGSYLICAPDGQKPLDTLPDRFRFQLGDETLARQIQETAYADGACRFYWRPCRPIPAEGDWFETVWREYRSGEIFRKI